MRLFLASALIVLAIPAAAQVQSRPTDPPIVTAENDAWYMRGDPVQFAGNNYYRAGARVFFDGNRMVRTGSFNGVPLYADSTVEPFSLVLVPIGRGLMQPYELPRTGDLAGTTGSHAPSFPVAALPAGWTTPMAATAPTSLISEPFVGAGDRTVGTAGIVTPRPSDGRVIETSTPPVRRAPLTPADYEAVRQKVTVDYNGKTWVNAGPAIRLEGSGLVKTGEFDGFPVFTRGGGTNEIYLPVLSGLVTPYRAK